MKNINYFVFCLLYADVCCLLDLFGWCSTECEWVSWSRWSDCSLTCGGGHRNRHRSICCPLNEHCLKDCGKDESGYRENQACNTNCFNDGKYDYNFGYCKCSVIYEGICCDKRMFLKCFLSSFFHVVFVF
jgi:hypothetical protein